MSRRKQPAKRATTPDARFNNVTIQAFINRMLVRGKKGTATNVMYDSLDLVAERSKRDSAEVFDQALRNVAPMIEVKPRRVGGATYQVPVEVHPDRRMTLAMRWILAAARPRGANSLAEKLPL